MQLLLDSITSPKISQDFTIAQKHTHNYMFALQIRSSWQVQKHKSCFNSSVYKKALQIRWIFLSLSVDLLAADSLSCGQSVSIGIFYHNRVWTWQPASNKWIKPGGWTWKALLIRNNFISENKYSQGQRWRVGKTGSSVQFVKCQVSMRCDTVNSNLKSTALELTANLTLF